MNIDKIKDSIFAYYEKQESEKERRKHALGASQIGRPCDREIWYGFRLCSKPSFGGRMLRLFRRGFDMEPQFAEELNAIGLEAKTHDEHDKQFRVTSNNGHCACNFDGIVRGIESEHISKKDWGLLEMKTHNEKSFKGLTRQQVEEAKVEHYAQMQISMGIGGLKFALYIAENKNDSDVYSELVMFDEAEFSRYEKRASDIINANVPPHRINDRLDWWPCKFCDAKGVCKQGKIPPVNCCTCCHSSPDADGKWSCKIACGIIPDEVLLDGCSQHIFIPAILPFDNVLDGDDTWIKYQHDACIIYNVADIGFTPFDKDALVYSSQNLFDLYGDKI
jgi:hypothetical protein